MAIDLKIRKFCRLIEQINNINKTLDESAENFYDGGTSFNDCNKYEIDILTELQDEFLSTLDDLNEHIVYLNERK